MSLTNSQVATRMSGSITIMPKPKDPEPLRDAVEQALTRYFEQLDGTRPNELYSLVLQQVEQPLFEAVMGHTGGNQSKAAALLGISRSTLRKKLAQYEIE